MDIEGHAESPKGAIAVRCFKSPRKHGPQTIDFLLISNESTSQILIFFRSLPDPWLIPLVVVGSIEADQWERGARKGRRNAGRDTCPTRTGTARDDSKAALDDGLKIPSTFRNVIPGEQHRQLPPLRESCRPSIVHRGGVRWRLFGARIKIWILRGKLLVRQSHQLRDLRSGYSAA